MTLDEAIKHAEDVSLCETSCGAEHAQLATWLHELRDLQVVNTELLDALLKMCSIVDAMGDMPDAEISLYAWKSLDCQDSLDSARATIAKTQQGGSAEQPEVQEPLNLKCKSTQKKLATLWGFVPAEAQEDALNAARYLAIRDYADAWAIEFTGNPEVMAGSGAMLDKIADEAIAARAQANPSNSI